MEWLVKRKAAPRLGDLGHRYIFGSADAREEWRFADRSAGYSIRRDARGQRGEIVSANRFRPETRASGNER